MTSSHELGSLCSCTSSVIVVTLNRQTFPASPVLLILVDCVPYHRYRSNERSGLGASEWTVILGRLKQNGSNPFEMKFNVTNITMSNETGSNVAVLHLQTRPTLSDYIQPICLGTTQIFGVGTTCYVAGWSFGQGGGEST